MAAQSSGSPQLIFIAGGNGCGKTTLWNSIVNSNSPKAEVYKHLPYLNVDKHYAEQIKSNPNANFSDSLTWRNEEINRLISSKTSFAMETLLDDAKIGYLKKAKKNGFETIIYFISLNSSALAVSRVAHRVSQGGHEISEFIIEAKWTESFAALSKSLTHSDYTSLFDNSSTSPSLVASFELTARTNLGVVPASWAILMPELAK